MQMNYEYRNKQAQKLQRLLKAYTETKYSENSVDKTLSPIGSQDSITLINKLIETKNFVIVPVNLSNESAYTHFYTIGLWYFWNIPEIVIKFDSPTKNLNPEIINLICDILVNKMLEINDNKYQNSITLNLDKIDLQCSLTLIKDDEYLDIQSVHLLWFYMFYVEAQINAEKQPLLFPVYLINFDQNKYNLFEQKIINKMIDNVDVDNNYQCTDSDVESLEENLTR